MGYDTCVFQKTGPSVKMDVSGWLLKVVAIALANKIARNGLLRLDVVLNRFGAVGWQNELE
jgi:hypothetical protein